MAGARAAAAAEVQAEAAVTETFASAMVGARAAAAAAAEGAPKATATEHPKALVGPRDADETPRLRRLSLVADMAPDPHPVGGQETNETKMAAPLPCAGSAAFQKRSRPCCGSASPRAPSPPPSPAAPVQAEQAAAPVQAGSPLLPDCQREREPSALALSSSSRERGPNGGRRAAAAAGISTARGAALDALDPNGGGGAGRSGAG